MEPLLLGILLDMYWGWSSTSTSYIGGAGAGVVVVVVVVVVMVVLRFFIICTERRPYKTVYHGTMFAYTVTVVSVYKYFQFARIIAFLGYCHEKTFFFLLSN